MHCYINIIHYLSCINQNESTMRTEVTRRRVAKIAENYLLPEPYETNHELSIQKCLDFVVTSNYVTIENGFVMATDQELELAIDDYFNN